MSKIAYQKKKIQKIKAALLNRQQCYKNLLNGFSEVKNMLGEIASCLRVRLCWSYDER
jgi:hypothetical protein